MMYYTNTRHLQYIKKYCKERIHRSLLVCWWRLALKGQCQEIFFSWCRLIIVFTIHQCRRHAWDRLSRCCKSRLGLQILLSSLLYNECLAQPRGDWVVYPPSQPSLLSSSGKSKQNCLVLYENRKSKVLILACKTFYMSDCFTITYYTLQRQFRLYIPFLGIARPQTQFPHSCVCERCIYSQDMSTYFLQQKRQTHRGNI